jgi:hypothetical protein
MKILKYSLFLALTAALFSCAKEDDADEAGPNGGGNGSGLSEGTLELRVTGDTAFTQTLTANFLRIGDTAITVSFISSSGAVTGNFTVFGDLLNLTTFSHADSSGVTNPPAYLMSFAANGEAYLGTAGTLTKTALGPNNFEGTIRNQRNINFVSPTLVKAVNVEVDFNAGKF